MSTTPQSTVAVDPEARPVFVGGLARLVLEVFFRRVEVVGAERLPRDRPLMLVANHTNGLVDPALLIGFLDVRPRFLAKSTLWRMAAIRPFLEMAAAIPVYRRQDPGVDPAQNAATFTACHEVLRAGGTIALFPEGRSHSEPALVPLKTGVSRIVLEAEAKYGGIGSRIVPVGLTFDDKTRFRSRALVHVGPPLDPTSEVELYRDDPREAVRVLTERVAEALAAVTLNFPSWEEAALIERAVRIYSRPTAELPAEPGLGEEFALRQAFIDGYQQLSERYPAEVERVAEAVREYDARLRDYRLRDVHLAAAYPLPRVALFVVKSLGLMALRAPLAAVGTVMSYLPYWAVGRVARRYGDTPDMPATYKLMGSLLFFPLTWLAWAAVAGVWVGLGAGLVVFALGPSGAYFALRYHERRRWFSHHTRAYLLLRSGRPGITELRRLRGRVLEAVRRLAEVYQAASEEASGTDSASSSVRSPVSDEQ